jgi:hypothetical protein
MRVVTINGQSVLLYEMFEELIHNPYQYHLRSEKAQHILKRVSDANNELDRLRNQYGFRCELKWLCEKASDIGSPLNFDNKNYFLVDDNKKMPAYLRGITSKENVVLKDDEILFSVSQSLN